MQPWQQGGLLHPVQSLASVLWDVWEAFLPRSQVRLKGESQQMYNLYV
jgi:hypothetical protein